MTEVLPTAAVAFLSLAMATSLPRSASADAAPSIAMFGSFFPGWLLALAAGVISTVVIRLLFVVAGVDDILPLRVPVYITMAVGLTFGLNALLFGR